MAPASSLHTPPAPRRHAAALPRARTRGRPPHDPRTTSARPWLTGRGRRWVDTGGITPIRSSTVWRPGGLDFRGGARGLGRMPPRYFKKKHSPQPNYALSSTYDQRAGSGVESCVDCLMISITVLFFYVVALRDRLPATPRSGAVRQNCVLTPLVRWAQTAGPRTSGGGPSQTRCAPMRSAWATAGLRLGYATRPTTC
jgi:hypothetical protein